MNSPDPLPDRSGPHAANDGEFYRNPLWEATLALACLATVLVCLLVS
jgi:hypothetical protein